MNKTQLLFLIILVEGYVVLASELLAIRQLIPFVGSGTETISIVISAVLLPLAIGYHAGGLAFKRHYRRMRKRSGKALSVRKMLLKNIITSLAILSLGLSYVFMEIFFGVLTGIGLTHRLTQTALYSVLFLVSPVYLLGQTVPLVSNYFSRRKLSEITGKMLFFSTAGSFLGSVFSTIILMTYIGVNNTVIVTMSLLCAISLLLVRRLLSYETFFCACIIGLLFLMNGNTTMEKFDVVSDNAYNIVRVVDVPGEDITILNANRSPSSQFSKDLSKQFSYWKYIQSVYLDPIADTDKPRDILVLGAGGFTIGLYDKVNRYTYVDIDKALKDVAEEHFLPEKLGPNKEFVAASARAFVHSDKKQYDFILIDTFTNMISIPQETTTREFLLDTKKLLKPDGVLMVNIISAPDFREKFTVRYHNTFASVFPVHSRQVTDLFIPWPGVRPDKHQEKKINPQNFSNILYTYYNHPLTEDRTVYTDDRNPYSLDRQ